MFRMKNKTIDSQEKVTRYWGTYIVLFLALGSLTFMGVCTPQGSNAGLSGSAAEVAGEKISYGEFKRAYQYQVDRLRSQNPDNFDPAKSKVAHSVLNRLVDERLAALYADQLGISTSEDEVVDYLTEADAFRDKDGKFSQEYFDNYLRRNGYSEMSFIEELKRSLTLQKLRDLVTTTTMMSSKYAELEYKLAETKVNVEFLKMTSSNVKVNVPQAEITAFLKDKANDAAIKSWYESHSTDYHQAEKVKARHILVAYKGARSASAESAKRTKEEAKLRAEAILKKVKVAGANFSAIAKKETDEPSGKKSGGDLGFFTKEAMVKQFSDVAFRLKKNEISNVVETPFGFHIIKLEARKAKKDIPLDKAKSEIALKLIKEKKAPTILETESKKILEELKQGKTAAALMAKHHLKWQKTGLFPINARYIPKLGSSEGVMSSILTLTKAKPLAENVLTVNNDKVIVRLVERKDADLSKFDEKRADQITQMSTFSDGYAFYDLMLKSLRSTYNKKQGIKLNPKFLALDNVKNNQGG